MTPSSSAHEIPRILAHRGTSEKFTENGIKVFEYCLENGITGFETDFRMTVDGTVVVMHDSDIKRTTTGEGIVEKMTLDQLKVVRLKNSDECVPTADELFSFFDNRKDFYIELEMNAYYGEYSSDRMDDFLDKLYAIAQKHLSNGNYMFTSFADAVLMRMKKRHPEAKVGLICGELTNEIVDKCLELKCYCVAATLDGTEKQVVDRAKATGLKVNLWHSETLALLPLVREVRQRNPGKSIWAYTGFVLPDLLPGGRAHDPETEELLACIDVLVDGPFVQEKKDISLGFRGFSNQRVINLKNYRKQVVINALSIGY